VSWQSSMGKDLKAASSSSSFSAGRADLGNPVPAGTNSILSSLLRSFVSQSSVIFQGEIGVFFPLIVLRSLDSSDGPLNQRASVLRMLERYARIPKCL
ncbi:hypothetical protein IFM89_036236, partial [Coptis chinensis]